MVAAIQPGRATLASMARAAALWGLAGCASPHADDHASGAGSTLIHPGDDADAAAEDTAIADSGAGDSGAGDSDDLGNPDDSGPEKGKMTQIIVPRSTPGVNIVRGVPVWGRASSHCEIIYDNVRVPKENQLGRTGTGHQAAQDRLGAGRVYHCMNSIGSMWRAFDLMVDRLMTREVHGGEKLEEKQFMQGFIADSYMDIQSARLMTIHCAEKMESGADPRTDISAIKVFVPQAYHRVVDRAIQVYGAAGVSGDLPLAGMYQGARTLRIADGPDEVHKILMAKIILRRYHSGEAWDFGN